MKNKIIFFWLLFFLGKIYSSLQAMPPKVFERNKVPEAKEEGTYSTEVQGRRMTDSDDDLSSTMERGNVSMVREEPLLVNKEEATASDELSLSKKMLAEQPDEKLEKLNSFSMDQVFIDQSVQHLRDQQKKQNLLEQLFGGGQNSYILHSILAFLYNYDERVLQRVQEDYSNFFLESQKLSISHSLKSAAFEKKIIELDHCNSGMEKEVLYNLLKETSLISTPKTFGKAIGLIRAKRIIENSKLYLNSYLKIRTTLQEKALLLENVQKRNQINNNLGKLGQAAQKSLYLSEQQAVLKESLEILPQAQKEKCLNILVHLNNATTQYHFFSEEMRKLNIPQARTALKRAQDSRNIFISYEKAAEYKAQQSKASIAGNRNQAELFRDAEIAASFAITMFTKVTIARAKNNESAALAYEKAATYCMMEAEALTSGNRDQANRLDRAEFKASNAADKLQNAGQARIEHNESEALAYEEEAEHLLEQARELASGNDVDYDANEIFYID